MAKTKVPRPDDYSPAEAAKRRDVALRAALMTPPTEHGRGPERKVKAAKRKPKKG